MRLNSGRGSKVETIEAVSFTDQKFEEECIWLQFTR